MYTPSLNGKVQPDSWRFNLNLIFAEMRCGYLIKKWRQNLSQLGSTYVKIWVNVGPMTSIVELIWGCVSQKLRLFDLGWVKNWRTLTVIDSIFEVSWTYLTQFLTYFDPTWVKLCDPKNSRIVSDLNTQK